MLPNFIISGAQKSGTTALRIYLNQHPDIFIAPKEIHYFDRDINYQKGRKWYEAFFVDAKAEKAIGEKTPDYLYFKKVPERINQLLPDVKLIFVFRNPVDRAFSHYWHKIRRGEESKGFKDAVIQSDNIIESSPYIMISRYVEQVNNYTCFFPKESMLFLMAEDLERNTKSTLIKVLNFLSIDPDFKFNDLGKKHIGGVPRSRAVIKLAYSKIFEPFGLLRDGLLRINTRKGKVPLMDNDLRCRLDKYFFPYNEKLNTVTQLNTGLWHQDTNG